MHIAGRPKGRLNRRFTVVSQSDSPRFFKVLSKSSFQPLTSHIVDLRGFFQLINFPGIKMVISSQKRDHQHRNEPCRICCGNETKLDSVGLPHCNHADTRKQY